MLLKESINDIIDIKNYKVNISNELIDIINYREVKQINSQYASIVLGNKHIEIKGKDICVLAYNKYEILLSGRFDEINYK